MADGSPRELHPSYGLGRGVSSRCQRIRTACQRCASVSTRPLSARMVTMITDLILGTAGHIDHGKTSLIRCLTGTDTDRLPEEKRRGITIELGFAEMEVGPFRLGIVDVPGHEKFVRQMLAGATGMDLAMLVIAADDSVKPQTREHLDVLRFLDLPAGIVVLTKCDVADPDWIHLVEDEVRELLIGSFLEDAAIVRTSAITGEGMDEVRRALEAAAQIASSSERAQRNTGPFRMPIDRAFTIAGHGTVVTGSVAHGRVSVGDQLVIEPGDIAVRVRGLQNHDRVVESVQRGQRAAINLAGIHHDQVTRGHELASPGHLIPSKLVTVKLDTLPHAVRPLKNRSRARVHIGTAEVLATVALVGVDRLQPGESGFAQLFLTEPIVSNWNQPFVLRSESPVMTIAGGHVVVPEAKKIRRAGEDTVRQLQALLDPDELTRADAAIYWAEADCRDHGDLSRTAGISDSERVFQQLVQQRRILGLNVTGHRKRFIHARRLDEYAARIAGLLVKLHDEHPLSSVFDRDHLASQFAYLGGTSVFDAVIHRMSQVGQVRLTDRGIGLAERGPQLSKGEQELLRQLIERFRDAAFQPPTVKECQQQVTKNQKSVPQLVALAANDGDLIEISSDYYLHRDVEARLRQILTEAMPDGAGLTLSEIRELLGTTRKYAVPICEYLDRIGFTSRDGDLRRLKQAPVKESDGVGS